MSSPVAAAAAMSAGELVLSAERAASLQQQRGLASLEELARELCAEIELRSLPTLSGFSVGVVAIGQSGALYCGVNLEFPPLPINGDTVHGEQCAVALAFLAGERRLRAMMTGGGFPCGHCRQFLCELAGVGSVDFLAARDQSVRNSMDVLLPGGFYPGYVSQAPTDKEGKEAGGTLFGDDAEQQELAASASDSTLLARLANRRETDDAESPPPPSLVLAAARAAIRSHAPYTRCRAGIALQLTSGEVVSGSSLESVAFNPGLPPLQVALIALLSLAASSSTSSSTSSTAETLTTTIARVALVEAYGGETVALTSWEDRTSQLLAALAPEARMDAFVLSPEAAAVAVPAPKI